MSSTSTRAEPDEEADHVDLWGTFAPPTQAILTRQTFWPAAVVRVEHLLLVLLEESDDAPENWPPEYEADERRDAAECLRQSVEGARILLGKLGVDVGAPAALAVAGSEVGRSEPRRGLSRDCTRVWVMATEEAEVMGSPQVWPEHVVLALLAWSRPRPWCRGPFARRDDARQVLQGVAVDLAVARVVVHDSLQASGDIETPRPWTLGVQRAVDEAHQLCIKTGCGRISSAHLILAMLRDEATREHLKYLRADEVEFDALLPSVRKLIRADGEASTSQPRFTREAAQVLERAKSTARRAGMQQIDEPLLLLMLAQHGGEAGEALRRAVKAPQVLARELYPKQAVASEAEGGWMPRGAIEWAAFWTAPVCWPLGMFLLTTMPRNTSLFWPTLALIAIPMLWMLTSIFAILIGRPARLKRACESFLSGFSVLMLLYFVGTALRNAFR